MLREMRATLSLAWPVMLADMGWVVMGLVDTIMVGPLGPAAIGAVGTGSSIFFAVMVFGMGIFYALDTFVSQNHGAGHVAECRRWLHAGLELALVLSVVLVLAGWMVVTLLPVAGIHPDVLVLLQPYLATLLWSAPALLLHTVLRRYLQAMHVVMPITVIIAIANIVNAVGNWTFVYGHLGVSALGAVGSAYATLVARVCLALLLWIVVGQYDRRAPGGAVSDARSGLGEASGIQPESDDESRRWRWDVERMRLLTRLGLPAAIQIVLEVGVFSAAAMMAGRISPVTLAANQVVLNVASFFFMLPLGLSSAAAVRVGHAIGRADVGGARRAGWAALAIALLIAAANATLFITVPNALMRIFTADASVLAIGATLMAVCASFQLFDALQAVATGALRGLGDTRTPMAANLIGHWCVGLPLAYTLCFGQGWGVLGLWTGLASSLTLIGITLVSVWRWRSARLVRLGLAPVRA